MFWRLVGFVLGIVNVVTGISVLADSNCQSASFSRVGGRRFAAITCLSDDTGAIPGTGAGSIMLLLGLFMVVVSAWPLLSVRAGTKKPQVTRLEPTPRAGRIDWANRLSDQSGEAGYRTMNPRNSGSKSDPLREAVHFAEVVGFPHSLIAAARQAHRQNFSQEPTAWCFSTEPERLLVAYGSTMARQFWDEKSWSEFMSLKASTFGVAPDGSIRALRIAGETFTGLSPEIEVKNFVLKIGARESEALNAVCRAESNAHWMKLDSPPTIETVGSSADIATRIAAVNQLHADGLISTEHRDERIKGLLNEI